MEGELHIYQGKVIELQEELQRLHKSHQEVKRRYYEQQKRDRVERSEYDGSKRQIHVLPPQLPRFTGGGFNLSL